MDPARIRHQVDAVLGAFIHHKKAAAREQGLPVEAPQALDDFLAAGGKRLRPLLCVLGWHTTGSSSGGGLAQAVQVGAALEMFHAFCLIHDDIMDHSDTRRGRPTVHRALAARHRAGHDAVLAKDIGTSAAILAGDLALLWSDELLRAPDTGLGPAQLEQVAPLIDLMRGEVLHGQYLDLISTGRPSPDTGPALAIIRYKTAKYTCERPLHIGAALAGADARFLDALSAFALPLGEAFQLRDDLLGVFGHQAETGKPTFDDLREGKHTVLISFALKAADDTQARLLRTLYGNARLDEDDTDTVRAVLRATGADQAVEHMITNRYEQALAALEGLSLPREVHHQLRSLADKTVWRTS
ncbi:polyprenyl synthetase family protein [Streptomyces formicae]|uniref:polyprenyl synthetase family protein n=1 Tax=Streptomyces formicae TaxID=1616117 RepID=UPI001F18EF81|nr:polyprenyl synthetase family protein [Streptomyces formicae]